mmetsp:Transcript_11359/g.11371  ORF Transcript_11359/g.11371 Transcript_11359/m.11371 type:complete len:178 (-) Transcript_11359:64-597(-)
MYKHYDEHAAKYDAIFEALDYKDPEIVAQVMNDFEEIAKFKDESGVIMDLGCGTGLSGIAINKVGFKNVIGLDASQEMLNRVPEGTYGKLLKNLVGVDPMPEEIKLNVDVCVCVSGMVFNHIPISIFETMLLVLKKGGYYVFNVRDPIWEGTELPYKATMEKLIAEGKFKEVKRHKF